MNAFISYSHKESPILELLHKHLAQLKREGIISTWSDNEIPAGGKLDANISSALKSSKLFIALLSPDYLASSYCYEKEFETALAMQEQGTMVIVPIIVEPCDWLNTPFKAFKALPKDGKAISTWENKNTAFLDVIQNLRKLVGTSGTAMPMQGEMKTSPMTFSRNYRVKKDFDSIEKLEFTEKTFHELKELMKRYVEEILQIENIRARTLIDTDKEFECLLVNRNKIATEAKLSILIKTANPNSNFYQNAEGAISYSIIQNNRAIITKSFTLSFDEYHLFWAENNIYMHSRTKNELSTKDIAETIWNEWLESVGIL